MKDYDKNILRSSSYVLRCKSFIAWTVSQKLPADSFKWKSVENTFQFNKNFIENYNENSDEGYFLEVDVPYAENLYNVYNALPFLPETMK